MALLRTPAVAATKNLVVRNSSRPHVRHLTTTPARFGGGHAPQYDQPGGWLWGIPPGTKPKKESWENIMIYGYCGAIVVTGIAYVFKPDTSIQTWALEEARRRLEKEGFLEDPFPDHVEPKENDEMSKNV